MKQYQNSQKNKSKTLEELAMKVGQRAIERYSAEQKKSKSLNQEGK